jgi:hypothetical protein
VCYSASWILFVFVFFVLIMKKVCKKLLKACAYTATILCAFILCTSFEISASSTEYGTSQYCGEVTVSLKSYGSRPYNYKIGSFPFNSTYAELGGKEGCIVVRNSDQKILSGDIYPDTTKTALAAVNSHQTKYCGKVTWAEEGENFGKHQYNYRIGSYPLNSAYGNLEGKEGCIIVNNEDMTVISGDIYNPENQATLAAVKTRTMESVNGYNTTATALAAVTAKPIKDFDSNPETATYCGKVRLANAEDNFGPRLYNYYVGEAPLNSNYPNLEGKTGCIIVREKDRIVTGGSVYANEKTPTLPANYEPVVEKEEDYKRDPVEEAVNLYLQYPKDRNIVNLGIQKARYSDSFGRSERYYLNGVEYIFAEDLNTGYKYIFFNDSWGNQWGVKVKPGTLRSELLQIARQLSVMEK